MLKVKVVVKEFFNKLKLKEKIFDNKIKLIKAEDQEFMMINQKVKGGSSISIHSFKNMYTNTFWIGKCSGMAIVQQKPPYLPDPFNEFKEVLALKIYSLFGVETPEVVVSNQLFSSEALYLLRDTIK